VTTLTFSFRGEDIIAVSVEGHSGQAEAGEDVVCAGVSSAVQMVDCQLYMQEINAEMTAEQETAKVNIRINDKEEIARAQLTLRSFRIVAKMWQEEYPDYISIQEVKLL